MAAPTPEDSGHSPTSIEGYLTSKASNGEGTESEQLEMAVTHLSDKNVSTASDHSEEVDTKAQSTLYRDGFGDWSFNHKKDPKLLMIGILRRSIGGPGVAYNARIDPVVRGTEDYQSYALFPPV